jgi:hypothetical protein
LRRRERLRAQGLDSGDALGHGARQPERQVALALLALRDAFHEAIHGVIVVQCARVPAPPVRFAGIGPQQLVNPLPEWCSGWALPSALRGCLG